MRRRDFLATLFATLGLASCGQQAFANRRSQCPGNVSRDPQKFVEFVNTARVPYSVGDRFFVTGLGYHNNGEWVVVAINGKRGTTKAAWVKPLA